jgi:hypothetical protein
MNTCKLVKLLGENIAPNKTYHGAKLECHPPRYEYVFPKHTGFHFEALPDEPLSAILAPRRKQWKYSRSLYQNRESRYHQLRPDFVNCDRGDGPERKTNR